MGIDSTKFPVSCCVARYYTAGISPSVRPRGSIREGLVLIPSIDLGLPTYVTDLWWNYGFTEAKRRVTLQQVGADTLDASNYYGAVLAAMNAIGGETVPTVPAFGGTPTSRSIQ